LHRQDKNEVFTPDFSCGADFWELLCGYNTYYLLGAIFVKGNIKFLPWDLPYMKGQGHQASRLIQICVISCINKRPRGLAGFLLL